MAFEIASIAEACSSTASIEAETANPPVPLVSSLADGSSFRLGDWLLLALALVFVLALALALAVAAIAASLASSTWAKAHSEPLEQCPAMNARHSGECQKAQDSPRGQVPVFNQALQGGAYCTPDGEVPVNLLVGDELFVLPLPFPFDGDDSLL